MPTHGEAHRVKEGYYRAVLQLDEKMGVELPFNFELKIISKKPLLTIHNADEQIVVDEVLQKGDSLFIRMPVFDTEFRVKTFSSHWEGVWINHYRKDKNILPFKAFYGQNHRFVSQGLKVENSLEGRWEVQFKSSDGKTSPAIGQFHHSEQTNFITGTFLTETGDYRYLEGLFENGRLQLSCFDGSHAFLFDAVQNRDGALEGVFYSGSHSKENWSARRNAEAGLRKAEEIVSVKDPSADIRFAFPDTEGRMVSSEDSIFLNKVLIVQVMGSWCPNCIDESRYFKTLYEKYAGRGLRIVALAFEKSTDPELSRKQVLRMKDKLGLPYPVLITALSGKDKASEKLPFLSSVPAFPTTLFLDRQRNLVRVHTGFNGPATGQAYVDFVKDTENLIEELLEK